MRVDSIKLKNFRNYSELKAEFDGKRNIIMGENAQGKTNLIEAIYQTLDESASLILPFSSKNSKSSSQPYPLSTAHFAP